MKSPRLLTVTQKCRRRLYVLLLWTHLSRWLLRAVRRVVTRIAAQGLLVLAEDMALDEKDKETIWRRSINEDNFIGVLLPRLGKSLDRSLADGYFNPCNNFRTGTNGLPIFLRNEFNRVFDQRGVLRPDACALAIRKIRQVCFYAYKLDLPYEPSQVSAVLESFLATEREMVKFAELAVWSSNNRSPRAFSTRVVERRLVPSHPVVMTASWLVQTVFKDFDPERLKPRHGPGVTANVEITKKWSSRLATGSPYGPLNLLYWFNESDAEDRWFRCPTRDNRSYFAPSEGEIAKVILVPKDSRGPRLISAEPAERQFLQQAIKGQITEILESHRLTRGHVNFTDQTVNRDLALVASKSQQWATIDLKDASDRVSLELVDLLFGGTELKRLLMHVRSTHTQLPSGEIIALNKYAPMGSALCFPVLATCVWALAATYLLGISGSLEYACDSVFVYGDDLIVPSEHAHGVITTLESTFLKVNVDKSFIASRFAESCGMDAFDGIPVTPVRLKSLFGLFIGDEFSRAKALVSLVGHSRELACNGYSRSSEFFAEFAEAFLGPLPYATDTAPFLGRFCRPEDWSVLHNEWMERVGGERKRNLSVYVVKSRKGQNSEDCPWSHIYRTSSMWGSGLEKPDMGSYDLPRKFLLSKRTVKGNSFACGVYSVPKWVKALERNLPGIRVPSVVNYTGSLPYNVG